MPSASLTSVRVKPVFGLLAVTVAPGVAAPWGSRTRPEMLPVVCCANPDALVSSQTIAAPTRFLRIHASSVQKRYETDPNRLGRSWSARIPYSLRLSTQLWNHLLYWKLGSLSYKTFDREAACS